MAIFFKNFRLTVKMNRDKVFVLHSLPGAGRRVESHPRQVELFDLLQILKLSGFGLPCGCCYASHSASPVEDFYYQTGKRLVNFCANCSAMICRECSWHIMRYQGEQAVGCKWCGEDLRLDTRLLSSKEEKDPSFLCYTRANENIKGIMIRWCHSMHDTYKDHELSKIFWANMINQEGWRFLVKFDILVVHQHPNQFKLLNWMMLKSAFSEFQNCTYIRQEALRSYSQFYQMPHDMQFLYRRSKDSAIIHKLSFVIAKKMTAMYSTILSRYLLAKYAQRLAHSLAICDLT